MVSLLYKSFIHRVAISALTLVASGVFFVSCFDEPDIPNPLPSEPVAKAGYLTVSLQCSNHSTRADEEKEPGIDALNENKIKNVTLCLTPTAGDRIDENDPVFIQTFTDLDANGSVLLRVPLTMELVTRLFNENNTRQCRVFAAVNVGPTNNAKTIAELRALTVNSTFAIQKTQDSFTMDGDGTVEYKKDGNYAVGEVKVKRSAAKITLALDVDEEVTEVVGEKTLIWKPNLDGMRVRLQQGVHTSKLDPKPSKDMSDEVYFNTPDNLNYNFKAITRPDKDKYAKYNREQDIPFYTYPNKWTNSLDEHHGTFMLLSVPWSSDGGNTWRTCYYHVPIIRFDQFELVRNISYHIYLHVGVLGSFVPEEPMEIEGDYFVADWGNENIDVEIKDYRYLVVDQNEYVVNNENSITIPFYTSHPTKVISAQMSFYRYNFSDQGSEFEVTVSKEQNDASVNAEGKTEKVFDANFNNTTKELVVDHDLVIWEPYKENGNPILLTRRENGTRADLDNTNEINQVLNSIHHYQRTEDSEYSAIKFEIIVQHIDVAEGKTSYPEDSYQEKITIWQYPGMYITAVQNYCQNLGNNWTANANWGNTFINGNTSGSSAANNSQVAGYGTKVSSNGDVPTSSVSNWSDTRKMVYNYTNWEKSIGLGTPEQGYFNWNPNLYLVTITQLDPELGKKYKIDDPRTYNINNNLSNNGKIDGKDYTVDGGTSSIFTTEYWYYKNGNNNNGPEYNTDFFNNKTNPITDKRYAPTLQYWNEYIIRGFQQAPALDLPKGETRTLKYYYPARESEDNKNTLAPKFRICSSYAGSRAQLTREMARRRAAAYQEIGYCAGRWRLPTFGEVEYIMSLSAQEKIPRLFGTNANGTWCYWCAQGAVVVPAGNADNKDVYISKNPSNVGSEATSPFTGDNYRARARFVYDEWYWGEGTLTPEPGASPNSANTIYTFTWGDREKSNPQN